MSKLERAAYIENVLRIKSGIDDAEKFDQLYYLLTKELSDAEGTIERLDLNIKMLSQSKEDYEKSAIYWKNALDELWTWCNTDNDHNTEAKQLIKKKIQMILPDVPKYHPKGTESLLVNQK